MANSLCLDVFLLCCSVADPHHVDADADLDPDPACHFDADADPNPIFHFDADPDPNPDRSFQIKAQTSVANPDSDPGWVKSL